MGEAFLAERLEQEIDRLLVAGASVLVERDACLGRDPAVATPDTELVAPAGEDVRHGDRRREHGRVVVRKGVQHRPEADPARALRSRREERGRIRRDGELGKEEVLDHRVGVIAEPVCVLDLLEHLRVEALGRLPGVKLDLRVEAEPHGAIPFQGS